MMTWKILTSMHMSEFNLKSRNTKNCVFNLRVFNELKNFLQSNNGYTLTIANAVFYQSGFLSGEYSSYLELRLEAKKF